jgi:hypothetical protein
MREVIAVLGTLVGVLIAVQFLARGGFSIGSTGGNPYLGIRYG